jgi:hypothetical protein
MTEWLSSSTLSVISSVSAAGSRLERHDRLVVELELLPDYRSLQLRLERHALQHRRVLDGSKSA